MGRPRKPTAILKASGALHEHPGRYRDRLNEPKPTGRLGPPPDWFNETQVAEWVDVVRRAHKGVICSADWHVLRSIAILGAKIRTGEARLGEIALHAKLLGRFGMDAASRSTVSPPAQEENLDPFSEI
jgi:hypothetical protein